jgi:3-hydroxyacyl-[acyl-carrier-protein] dehydratase/UDP-3-O-[3-hydroxymyristoyl] N-acetylglucosamine deacetylase/3-hydroxyacyl-[acyl-carrier-protein] dehydratase
LKTIEEILTFLPHRYPFLLVDRVLDLEKGKSIVAVKNVTINEPFFQGHFPGLKVMPGVLVMEALAQAGGILIYHSVPDPEKKFVLLSKIEEAKFKKPVVPGDQMRLEAHLLWIKNKFCSIRGMATVGGESVAEGVLIAAFVEIKGGNERK